MTAAQIEIRRLSYTDLPQVIAIEQRAFPTPWSLGMFVIELAKPSGVCLAAVIDRKLVGYLICSHYVDAWHLMNVAVDPSRLRAGIGSALLRAMLASDESGSGRYTLEVRTSNTPAIELYQRFGFTTEGRRRNYYRDTGEDALIMWREPESSLVPE